MSHRGLVDRDRELQELLVLIDGAAGGHGRVGIVEGPAGIGKTRLLAAGRELAEARGLRVLTGSGSELERDFPFGVVRQLFEPLLSDMTEDERDKLFEGAAGHARPLLLRSVPAGQADGDPDYATLYGLYWLTAGLSARHRLYLSVDDLHWADVASLRFLAFLARRLDDLSACVCGALRPAEAGAATPLVEELGSSPGASFIRPAPLTPEGAEALIEEEVGRTPEAEFVDACLEATGGNPFYLRSLLAELAGDLAPSAADSGRVRELGAQGISRMLLRRLTALSPGAVELAQALCVLGDGTTLHRAARLAGLDDDAARQAAAALERAFILAPGERLAFVHPVVRTSIYQDMPAAERAERHTRAARLLSEEGADLDEVGAQLVLTEARDEWSVEQLRGAAAWALARGAPETGAAYLRRALPAIREPEERAAMLHELARAETLMRDPASIGHLEEARSLSTSPVLRAAVAVDLVQVLVYLGKWDPAASLARSALEELGGRERRLELMLEVMWTGTSAYDSRLVGDVEARWPELHRAAEEAGDAGRSLTLLLAGLQANRGAPRDEVIELVERGLDHGRFVEEEGIDSPVIGQALMALLATDELQRAELLVEQIEAVARARGSVVGFSLAVSHRGAIALRRGDLVTAESEFTESLAVMQEHGQIFPLPTLLWWAVECLAERPDNKQFAELAEAIELPAGMAATLSGALLLEARGRSRLFAGDAAGAVEALRPAEAIYTALHCRNPGYYSGRTALALALQGRDRDEALSVARSQLEDARRTGMPRAEGLALRTLGLVEGGEPGMEALAEAVAVLERSPSRLERARALVELGASLRRANRRTDARDPLGTGLQLAVECGATLLAERARTELRATGARPRRDSVSGVASLTPSERRIAEMAASGLSNPEIAQALFVTVKTVEGHLSGAYRKLGVRARTELGVALGD